MIKSKTLRDYFIDAYWWNFETNAPHYCLIEGDTNTRINLGYFKLVDDEYKLTEYGMKSFKKWLANYGIEENKVMILI